MYVCMYLLMYVDMRVYAFHDLYTYIYIYMYIYTYIYIYISTHTPAHVYTEFEECKPENFWRLELAFAARMFQFQARRLTMIRFRV